MKIKNMQRLDPTSKDQLDYQYKVVEKGVVGLLKFIQTDRIEITTSLNKKVVIRDNGMEWLEIAYYDKKYWVTALYSNDQLLQIYIDMIFENDFSDLSNVKMKDLYLDVIADQDGIEIRDQEELEEALRNNEISMNDYIEACNTCFEVINHLSEIKQEVEEYYGSFKTNVDKNKK